ncbi:AsmA-like protein [Christiangramia gaetbulicola]|uniref:AsmA-like protein n=1 Tax=Christiangramia gaetbulicola TaxID=703340 RepID=A0A2T6AIU2_9FLAO|nr:AsmA-like C-terminal region-containing protein [Christiangramia gaetbulicola]PTX43721.1 AsmA-like protein [Christiangramia gaetbulicola]
MKPEPTKHRKSRLKLLKRIGLILAVLLLAPTLLFTIGWFNRDLLIDQLQDWYKNNSRGQLEIGKVDATFLKGFPNVGFTINDIYQSSFDTILDKRSTISIKQAQVSIAAADLLSGNLEFKNIKIQNAEIHTEVISEKTVEEYVRLKMQKQADPSSGLNLPEWLSKKTDFSLRDVHFISKDTMLHKYFDVEVHNANGSISMADDKVSGKMNFKGTVNDLGFNTRKGSYINGAMVTGSPEFLLDQNTNLLSVPEFLMEIGTQNFKTKADFDFNATNSYYFSLQNTETDFQELKELLPENITAKLSPYNLTETISADLRLKGKFRYGDVPYIDADFSTSGNSGSFKDSLQLENIELKGYLTNTLSKEKDSANYEPSRRDIKIYFEDFNADLEDIKIFADNSYYQSSEEAHNYMNAHLKMYGSNETLARVMQNSNFNFIGGSFDLVARIDGDIPNTGEVFNSAEGRFTIRNTRVVLNENNLQLPVQLLDIKLKQNISVLDNLIVNLPNEEQFIFNGTIKNISSLMADDPEKPALANVFLKSEALNINDLITTAKEFIPPAERSGNDLKTLHQTFNAIYRKFQPRFRLDINSVEYNDNTYEVLEADIQLTDPETVSFSNLGFIYQDAFTELKGTLKIPKPDNNFEEPIFLNVAANSSGPLKIFQDLFNIQLLDINTGEYTFSGNLTGNVQKTEELLRNINGDLKLLNASFYYPEAAIDIEFDSLKVGVHDSNIKLDRFIVEIGEHHPFSLRGRIEDFPGFLLDSLQSTGKIFVTLDSPLVDMDDWMKTVNSMDLEKADKSLKKRDLYAVFSDIYRFDPEFNLVVDTLKYKELVSKDINAKVYFEDESTLKLEDLKIKFRDSRATIRGELAAQDLNDSLGNQNPFNFKFSAEASGRSNDLNDLLQTVNFDLRSGNFEFRGSYNGQASDLKIMNSNASGDLILGKTRVDIKGTSIQVPVDSLHLYIENNLATLERLDVELPGKSSIDITGKIDNFSNFINNDQAIDSHNSSFKITSTYLDNKDIKTFIGADEKKKDSAKAKPFEMKNLKDIISKINNSYFPSATIEIDSLIYNKMAFSNFASEIGFNNSGDLKVDNTSLEYFEASAKLMLQAGLETSKNLPVRIKMNIEDLAIENLVKDLDYFKDDELRKAEKIGGDLDLNFDVNGILDERGKLKMNSLNGTMQVDITGLALYDYQPLIESVVLLKEERFERLEFQPIRQTFEVVDGKIMVPRTQLQSTAMQVFVEGELKPGEYYNLWISVPWNNIFKSRDGIELPEKISFEKSGAKFYLQIVQDKESEKEREQKLKTKFRLGNRKLEKSKEN